MKLRSHPSTPLVGQQREQSPRIRPAGLFHASQPRRHSRQVIPMVLYELRSPTRSYPRHYPIERKRFAGTDMPQQLRRITVGTPVVTTKTRSTPLPAAFSSAIGYHSRLECNRSSLERCSPCRNGLPGPTRRVPLERRTGSPRPFCIFRVGYTPERNNLMINQVRLLFGRCRPNSTIYLRIAVGAGFEPPEILRRDLPRQQVRPEDRHPWWNIRDGWPLISDAVVDYYFSPKMAYWFLRNVQRNVCVLVNDAADGSHPLRHQRRAAP